ncbi:RagB/SusD family nutrient uptake outer membrane protein [Marinilabilia salmonicolor]|uniref:RagB/SusD family nutrient uptake outer membrane protein n=1 Tax=Marinilabilia salmonicolor TaxID=989 RepID=UPI00029B3BA6|nr:RagB/SusD family nutrient uptake outer membrane protein [Marinilabilia salmonicolor]
MKKILYILIGAVLLMGCEDFLETETLTDKTSANFPQTADDAEQMMAGIYTTMNNAQHLGDVSYEMIMEVASDDKLGGGGNNDVSAQSYETFQYANNSMLENLWKVTYQGIHRANFAIENMGLLGDDVVSPELKNQYLGEAKFLRAYFYSRLNTVFNEVPLKLTTENINMGAASADEINGQIAADLKDAIELLPNKTYDQTQQGRVTKWAAEALMGRVFLWYTGFYGKDAIALPDGGSVTKNDVIGWLEDAEANSGHRMVDHFHQLWAYTNSLTIGEYDYIQEYISENNIDQEEIIYASDRGARNPETIFALQFSNYAGWDIDRGYSNTLTLFWGLRGMQDINKTVPFAGGWGQGNSVPGSMVNQWLEDEPNDPRLWASVIDLNKELMDSVPNLDYPEDSDDPYTQIGYNRGVWDFVLESNYWGKKYNGVTAVDGDGVRRHSYGVIMYGTPENNQLNHTDDLVYIRYADVLLMLAELKEDESYINRVRNRAGLPDIGGYSLDALQKERRHEFAFEMLRWNDMRRWGDAYTTEHLEMQEGVSVYNFGQPATHTALHPDGYTSRYQATKGFFPIPQPQIDMSEGLLEQVEGYKNGEGRYTPSW